MTTMDDIALQLGRIEDKLDTLMSNKRCLLSAPARLVYDTLKANGGMPTGDIAEMLEKNYTTTSQILNRLLRAGLVKKTRLDENHPGRKREIYEAIET